jgi:bifunctional non-homologous end joining protein LigD
MLATAGKDVPAGQSWIFEPKYDGIRIIALLVNDAVALITRNGHDKRRQFPEVSDALRTFARKLGRNIVLDGEIVALGEDGEPLRFQDLQGRMHVTDDAMIQRLRTTTPVAFVAFDILVDGEELLVERPWDQRRRRLERVLRSASTGALRLTRVAEDAAAIEADARAHGWEGIMAKRRDCPYEPGRRVRHWQKIKLENQQEFVVGGWTEPRSSRKSFGALLLGYYDGEGNLVYAGHTGTGFTDAVLDDVGRKLARIERPRPPFAVAPRTNERAHWAEPRYVAEVRFNEWTAGGNLRQPVFLGLRDDKDPRDVVREAGGRKGDAVAVETRSGKGQAMSPRTNGRKAPAKPARGARRPKTGGERARHGALARSSTKQARAASRPGAVVDQLRANPKAANASIELDAATKLAVTNLGKMFFPAAKITKGRLLEYYAEISPYLLPALADRPLVLKRYPNGIGAEAFYQQKAPDKVPPGIRVEPVADDGITTERRLIGGNLATLLYIVQLGAISTDPWHSRVATIAEADYSIIDLDPGPKATFKRVIQVARWVKEVLDEFGLHAVAKTSGASGIHVVMPLPRGASYEVSVTLAELVARRVNEIHPRETTVHRWVKSRPPAAVYVDYLQNIRGKTVASVYSARAEPHASVSTPLKWSELTDDLRPKDFTILNVPARVKRVGDLWAMAMKKTNRLPGVVGGAAA